MSDSISEPVVKQIPDATPEFYRISVGDKVSIPYPIASLDAVLFIDSLKEAGWSETERDGKVIVISAPEEMLPKLALYMGRVAA